MNIQIRIPGKPIAKRRPRFARRGKFVTTYSDQETEEGRFILELKSQLKSIQPIPAGTCIFLDLIFRFPYPKSMSLKKREATPCPTVKPDLDNCIKFVKDCCNRILWHDDSQVVTVNAIKIYSEVPETLIEVTW